MNEPVPSRPAYETGTEWLRGEGDAAEIVMSSRVRLARNLAGFPFVHRASREQRRQVLELCRSRIASASLSDPSGGRLMWVDLHDSTSLERTLLVERHLISRQHARGCRPSGATGVETPSGTESGGEEASKGCMDDPRGLAVSLPHERLSIMINEEDHLRLQAIRSGLDLEQAWRDADALDDLLEGGLGYAFSPRWGYLTACPTNVGTGVRFSVMLHLPALRITGNIEKVKRAASDMALAVRGFYGEGSEAVGDFYQISNQTTLGKSERTLLEELQRQILPRVIEYERAARRTLLTRRRPLLEDQVHRALGVLASARLMTTEEAMQLLSQVRLGVVLGLVNDVDLRTVHHLMLLVQPAHLQRAMGNEMDQEARRGARAELIRARIRGGGSEGKRGTS